MLVSYMLESFVYCLFLFVGVGCFTVVPVKVDVLELTERLVAAAQQVFPVDSFGDLLLLLLV